MKQFLLNVITLLCFVGVCVGASYLLPINIVMGVVIALQIINLVASATKNERRDDDG